MQLCVGEFCSISSDEFNVSRILCFESERTIFNECRPSWMWPL